LLAHDGIEALEVIGTIGVDLMVLDYADCSLVWRVTDQSMLI
jgi:hypothetical protein